MKNYTKNFIGKGIQNPNLNIVKVTLKVAEIEKFKHEYNGQECISFELAKLQNDDQFGRTHTAYVSTKAEDEPKVKKETPAKKHSKKIQEQPENLPF